MSELVYFDVYEETHDSNEICQNWMAMELEDSNMPSRQNLTYRLE